MSQYCKLTGVDLSKDGASNGIKSMCLNCKSCILDPCQDSSHNEKYLCNNEKVIEAGRQKILASIPDGFEVETLTLKPMALKDPTKKCRNYSFDLEAVTNFLESWFYRPVNAERESVSYEKENAPE